MAKKKLIKKNQLKKKARKLKVEKKKLRKSSRKLKVEKKMKQELLKLTRQLIERQPYPDEPDDEYKIIGIGKCSYCGNNTFVKKNIRIFCSKCGSGFAGEDDLSKKKIEKLNEIKKIDVNLV